MKKRGDALIEAVINGNEEAVSFIEREINSGIARIGLKTSCLLLDLSQENEEINSKNIKELMTKLSKITDILRDTITEIEQIMKKTKEQDNGKTNRSYKN